MLRVTNTVHYWKVNDVVELLRDAATAVEKAGLPEELEQAAFVQACGLLAQAHRELEQVAVGVPNMHIPGNRH